LSKNMADHRKSFRLRHFGIGGRLLPRGRLLGVVLALLGALGPVHAPASAQDAGLKSGTASLKAGKYESAVRQLSATVNHANATKGQAAEALYLRGIAYRKLGRPGRAIADLGAAVWLGLPTSEKVRALVNKGLAYRAAGLSSQANAAFEAARKASSSSTVDKIMAEDGGAVVASSSADTAVSASSQSDSGESVWSRLVPSFGSSSSTPPPQAAAQEPASTSPRTEAAAPKTGWNASVADETSQPSGNAVSRWFGSLAGESAPAPSSQSSPSPAPAAAPKPAPPKRTAAAPPSAASWSANTQTQKVVSEESGSSVLGRWFGGESSESAPPSPAATPAGGGYTVQLANSRSEAEAQALWKKVSRSNRQLASATPRIEKVKIGSFGTFYSLRIGPYASREQSTSVCNALKRSGTDCSVISPEGP
jgi:hypothetical protein